MFGPRYDTVSVLHAMNVVLPREPHGEIRASFVDMLSTLCDLLSESKAHDAGGAIFDKFIEFARVEAPTCDNELLSNLTFLTLYCRCNGVWRA